LELLIYNKTKLSNKITISKYKSNITRKIIENMYNNISISRGLVDNDERVDAELY